MGQAADVLHRKIAAFNAQDAEEVRALLDPDVEWAIPGGLLRGPDQALEFFSALWEAFSDIELTATRVAEKGSPSLCKAGLKECIKERSNPWRRHPSHRQTRDLTYSEHYEAEGGLIVSARLLFDRLDLLEQLGVAPAPAPA
jgi:hypothetical protein